MGYREWGIVVLLIFALLAGAITGPIGGVDTEAPIETIPGGVVASPTALVPSPSSPSPEGNPPPTEEEVAMATEHFAFWEFACDCGGRHCSGWPEPMNPGFLEKLEALREALGAPVIITSGVRCPVRNVEVGGIQDSYHLRGLAADLYCPDASVEVVAEQARSLGLGVIVHDDQCYVHVEAVI